MREILIKALELAQAVAQWTPTTVDDRIVQAVEAILKNDELMKVIVDILERWLSDRRLVGATLDSANVGFSAKTVEEIEDAGIDIPTILAIIRLVMEIIDKWRNR